MKKRKLFVKRALGTIFLTIFSIMMWELPMNKMNNKMELDWANSLIGSLNNSGSIGELNPADFTFQNLAVENLQPSAPNATIIEGMVNPKDKDIKALAEM